MSLGEGLDDINLLDLATDKMNWMWSEISVDDNQWWAIFDPWRSRGERYFHVPDESTCSKQQFQIVIKKDLQDPERWQWKGCCTKRTISERKDEKSIADW